MRTKLYLPIISLLAMSVFVFISCDDSDSDTTKPVIELHEPEEGQALKIGSEYGVHKLKTDCYKMFSEETRNNLKNSVYDKQHFEEYVSDIEELFEVWRYNFEYEKKTSHYSFVLEYARALKTECKRILLEKRIVTN